MEKKNKLRAGRICVGATINSLAATSAFVVIALLLYELTGKLNVPYSTLSMAYTFAYAGMMLASFFGGKIITRNGRLGPVISTSAALFGLLSLTFTNSVWLVYVAALVFGFGQVLTFFYMNIAIVSWYGVGQSTVPSETVLFAGTALPLRGVAQAATTVGAAVVTPVVASLLESSGYTKAGIVLTAIIVVTMCVSTLLLCGDMPSKYGMSPVDLESKKDKKAAAPKYEVYQAAMPSGRALRTPVFFGVALLGFCISVGTNVYNSNQYPMLTSFGIDMMTAAKLVSLGLICNAAGSIIIGWLTARLGLRTGFLIPAISLVVVFFLGFTIGGIPGAILIACSDLFFTYSKLRQGIIFNSLFGNKVSPDLIVWDGIAVCIASMFAGPLAALISEKSGSYQLVGYIATAIFAVCVLLLLYLTSDKTREHIKEIDAPYKEKEQA